MDLEDVLVDLLVATIAAGSDEDSAKIVDVTAYAISAFGFDDDTVARLKLRAKERLERR